MMASFKAGGGLCDFIASKRGVWGSLYKQTIIMMTTGRPRLAPQ